MMGARKLLMNSAKRKESICFLKLRKNRMYKTAKAMVKLGKYPKINDPKSAYDSMPSPPRRDLLTAWDTDEKWF